MAPLPDGGFLIGGNFLSVNGLALKGLARLNSDGTLDRGWSATAATSQGIVNAIVVIGNDAYIGGAFARMGGQERYMLARITHADGVAVAGWRADVDQPVTALATDGTDLFVGGNFWEVGGFARRSIARVSLATGAVSPWINDGNGHIDSVAVDSGNLYVAAGSTPEVYRVSLAASNSRDPAWSVPLALGGGPSYTATSLAISDSFVYLGGWFGSVGGIPRAHLARVSKAAGAALDTTWTPATNDSVFNVLADGSGVIIAGAFTSVNGALRLGLAEVDLATGATTAWNPGRSDIAARSLAQRDGFVYAGFFREPFQVIQSSVVKATRATGVADETFRAFVGLPGGSVGSIAFAPDGRTYIAGSFYGVDGFAINSLARINADGSVDGSWRPNPNRHVTSLALASDGLVVGGRFTEIAGVARNRLAKLSTGPSAVADPVWSPDVRFSFIDGAVTSLAIDGANLFIGGWFDQVSGATRNRIAKVSLSGTGTVDTGWNANWTVDATIDALVAGGGAVYAGGAFTGARAGQANLVKLSSTSGARDMSWNPAADGPVTGLILDGSNLYTSGEFGSTGGLAQPSLARIDISSGLADPAWRPVIQDPVESMALRSGVLYTATTYQFLQGTASFGAAFSTATGTRDLSWTFSSASVGPMQARAGQVWAGLGFSWYGRQGVVAYPEAFCAAKPNGTACDGGVSNPARCHENVCVAANTGRYDFNSDNRPDIVYRNTVSGATYIWRMNGTTLASDQYVTTIDPSWSLVGHGDFNGDGKNDMVWRNNATGTAYVWYMNDGVYQSDAFLFTIDPVWKIEAVADFNKDGKPDFLFRHQTSGVGFIWYFNDTTAVSDQFLFAIDNQWIVENVGDFDNDGYPDFFFRNTSSGVGFVWYWNGTSLGASNYMFGIDPKWQVVQIADWNLDGKVDLLFRNRETGLVFVWYTNGTSLQGSDFITQIDPSWEIAPYR